MPIEDTSNSFEYKLKKAGLAEPLSTYLSDPNDPDRLAAGFVAVKTNPLTGVLGISGAVEVSQFLPEPPSGVVAVASEAGALVYFAPSLRAASYRVNASGGSVAVGAASPIFIPLSNGVAQTFTVSAIGSDGTVATSPTSNSVTPTALPAALAGMTGLQAWWDANQLPVVANGTAIASWPVYSGNGNTASQSSGPQQPLYTTAANWGGGATGRPAVVFDGLSSNGDNMLTTLNSRNLGGEFTVFVVASKAASLNGNGARDQRILSNEVTRSDRGWSICASDNTGGSGVDCFSVRGTTSEINATSAITLNTPYVLSVVTGAQVFLNGTRQAPQGFAVSGALPRNQNFALGAAPNNVGSVGFNGAIAEIQIWRGRLSNADRKKVQAYLATKYALTAPANDDTI